ncbi:MAG: oligosaccharide flippase family protein [Bacteroidota bacterium]
MVKIQQHLGKITWTIIDKLLFVAYGLVALVQFKYADQDEIGLYFLLMGIHTWLFIISDGFALQGIILYGAKGENRPKVNTMGLGLHAILTFGISVLIMLLRVPFSEVFGQPQLQRVALVLPIMTLITIPRAYCLKLLMRDLQMKQIFWMNLAWFSVRIMLTVYFIMNLAPGEFLTFKKLVLIDLGGMAAGSVAAILLTRGLLRFSRQGNISIKEYMSFGSRQAFVGALNNVVVQLDVFVVLMFFSTASVGVYGLAKSLFRAFQQAFDAVASLLYPGAVRLVAEDKMDDLKTLISKMLSFTVLPAMVVVLILEMGVSHWVITTFLPQKYWPAIGQFNVFALGAILMPFVILSPVLLALNAAPRLTKNVIIASIFGFTALVIVGYLQLETFIPLGILVYFAFLGFLNFAFVRKELNLPYSSLFRAVKDTRSFLKK